MKSAYFRALTTVGIVAALVCTPIGTGRAVASVTEPNLISNPGLETAVGAAPLGWSAVNGGANTAKFTHLSSGAHGGTRAVSVSVTAFVAGAVGWSPAPTLVSAGRAYSFTDWYKSTAPSVVAATLVRLDGSSETVPVANVPTKGGWTQATASFTIPDGVVKASFSHILVGTGVLTTDDHTLIAGVPTPFARPLVTFTFDDGLASQFTYARPVLQKYGVKASYFVITNTLPNTPNNLTTTQLQTLKSEGNEIASHSVSHVDLTKITAAEVTTELQKSQAALVSAVGGPITEFASPQGTYNDATVVAAAKYYRAQRTALSGFNAKIDFDPYRLEVKSVTSGVTAATVQGWVDEAARTNAWLIVLVHGVAPGTSGATPTLLDASLSYISSKGIAVRTMSQALDELLPQVV